jgi:hypothetical protein
LTPIFQNQERICSLFVLKWVFDFCKKLLKTEEQVNLGDFLFQKTSAIGHFKANKQCFYFNKKTCRVTREKRSKQKIIFSYGILI